MMSMKVLRFRLIVSATVLLLVAAGCGGDDTDNGDTASGGSECESNLIAIIMPPHDNIFFKAESDAAEAKAEELGYDTTVLVHDDDPGKQSQLIDTVIAQEACAIILDNAGADATVEPLRKAAEAGIASFLVDREINEEGVAIVQLISNNFQGAQLGAEEFARLMDQGGEYVELVGKDTDTNAHIRSDAYNEVLGQFPELKQVAQETANWDQNEAFQDMETLIQRFPDLRGVISGNDTMAIGAVAALQDTGMGDVIVVGLDGSPEAVEAIIRGEMHATVLQPIAEMAQEAVVLADQYMRDGSIEGEEKRLFDMILVTPDNAECITNFEVEPNCP